jgi:hypothetical protein
MSAIIASGMVSDMPKVATRGVVHTTHSALSGRLNKLECKNLLIQCVCKRVRACM